MERLKDKLVWILVGTRPEAIKQVPLYLACRKRFGANRVALVGTGQHRELLLQALEPFGVQLDVNLSIMRPGQSLSNSAAAVLHGLDELLSTTKPEWMVVQGDTTSAAMAALAAFHHGVKVAHNEAGLRSYDLKHPFPEEANRKLIAVVADLHLAPTEKAANALRREGIAENTIRVVGNTGIDAQTEMLSRPLTPRASELLRAVEAKSCEPVLLTAHRRENAKERVDEWFQALRFFLEQRKDLALIYPLHPNNLGREPAERHLKQLDRVFLIDPLDYPTTCQVVSRCRFVVTDSGGIQEEASTLGVPVVVCRETTERSEAVDAGLARLAGTNVDRVIAAMNWGYENSAAMKSAPRAWPFGDGRSSDRIAEVLERFGR
jgi:UDP-N-acetylglucosamine 2-epimerase (non-hydrolysing)